MLVLRRRYAERVSAPSETRYVRVRVDGTRRGEEMKSPLKPTTRISNNPLDVAYERATVGLRDEVANTHITADINRRKVCVRARLRDAERRALLKVA